MLRQVKQIAIAATTIVAMAASAGAATIIDFRDGAAGAGGSISWDGTNVLGTNLPIGELEVIDAPLNNGVFAVTGGVVQGSAAYGDLDFDTSTGAITLSGCIPGLGVGTIDAGGTCTGPVALLGGTVTGSTVIGPAGIVLFNGFDTKSSDLLTAIGLSPTTTFDVDGFALLTGSLLPNGPAVTSNFTALRNVPTSSVVPEPATMILLGTGLLAAFRARRRTA